MIVRLRLALVASLLAVFATSCEAVPAYLFLSKAPGPVPTVMPAIINEAPPADWNAYNGDGFSLWVPPTWQPSAVPPTGTLQLQLPTMSHEMTQTLNVDAQSKAMVLSIVDTTTPPDGFTDNLNVQRTAYEGAAVKDLQGLIEQIKGEYQKVGFKVTETGIGMTAAGQPQARIAYTFQIPSPSAGDQKISAKGIQYVVLTGTDAWTLSYTIALARSAILTPSIDLSAQTFRVET